jgi:two-component system nitrogen regulation response regulator NtrX
MRILVVDDNESVIDTLGFAFRDLGWTVDVATNGLSGLNLVSSNQYDVILQDLGLPDIDGADLLRKIRPLAVHAKIIVISGSMGVSETVQVMKLGAYHCFSKPLNLQSICATIKEIAAHCAPVPANESSLELVAVSAPMQETYRNLRAVARGKTTTVLITGETGVGKEIAARRLHRLSDRRDKPFVAINCSAIPATLIESELFGHEKGAFTDARATRKGYFEAAADGTIFLDEIGDLSLELQTKLLRVLQERTFRRVGGTTELPLQARIVAATNVNLAKAVKDGKFREDLYYRLAVIPIHLQPLRERREDILPLAERFIRHLAQESDCPAPALSAEQTQRLLNHKWYGNVRELRNVMERFVLTDGQLEFFSAGHSDLHAAVTDTPAEQSPKVPAAIDADERKMIYSVLLKELLNSGVTLHPAPGSPASLAAR